MNKCYDENRCSTCAKRNNPKWGVDAFKGTRNCFSEATRGRDIVCMNWEQENGGEKEGGEYE